jgi:hypothetical protein
MVTQFAYRAHDLVYLYVLPPLLASDPAARAGDRRWPQHWSDQLYQPIRGRSMPNVALRVAAEERVDAGSPSPRVGDAQHAVLAGLDVGVAPSGRNTTSAWCHLSTEA